MKEAPRTETQNKSEAPNWQVGNPKHQIRNKFKCSKKAKFKTNAIRIRGFGFSDFWDSFVPICFEFRYSDLEFIAQGAEQ